MITIIAILYIIYSQVDQNQFQMNELLKSAIPVCVTLHNYINFYCLGYCYYKIHMFEDFKVV